VAKIRNQKILTTVKLVNEEAPVVWDEFSVLYSLNL